MELPNENQTNLEHQRSPGSRKDTAHLLLPHAMSTTSFTTTNTISAGASASKNFPKTTLLRASVTPILTPPCEPHIEAGPQVHPFANSTSKLELIPPSLSTTVDGIDVEEEARLYDELCRSYEDETDAVGPSLSFKYELSVITNESDDLKFFLSLVPSVGFPRPRPACIHIFQTQTQSHV